ncbi:hypothetical protein GCM10027184_30680 [Saccharothrix stipae]
MVVGVGELLTEERGRTVSRRVVSIEGGAVKVEVTFEARGVYGGIAYADIGTYWSVAQPGGTLYSEWLGGMKTDHGAGLATWRGFGAGRLGERDVRAYRGSVITENATGELAGLAGVLAVFEFSIDDNGDVVRRTWELS